ncbi:MAG TPA: hypothetical protein VEL47_01480 [Myxococcota bacterium]|nr:hypothetical protein [Myxococcota bacterium]
MLDDLKELNGIRERVDFLGYEFLTWLFLFLDHEDAPTDLEKVTSNLIRNSKITVILGERLVTCLFAHKEQKTTVASPVLESSHEVFASIKNGHLIEALSVKLSIGDINVGLALHAQDFAFTQIKIKNRFEDASLTDPDDDLDEHDFIREEIFLRTQALKDVERVIDALFARFLEERLRPKVYQDRLNAMRQQVEARLGSYLHKKATRDAEGHALKLM